MADGKTWRHIVICQSVIGRIVIGLSLATFVTCQVWCSQFFAKSIVGTVNATAGGWGNLGGGITLLTMPYIMEFFLSITKSDINASWRLCMCVPIVMHLASAFFIWGGRDLPDGSYKQLEATGAFLAGSSRCAADDTLLEVLHDICKFANFSV